MKYIFIYPAIIILIVMLLWFSKYQACIKENKIMIEENQKNTTQFNQTFSNLQKVKLNNQKKLAKYNEKNNTSNTNIADDFLLQAIQD